MEGLNWISPSNGNKTPIISEKEILLCKAIAKVGHEQQKCYRAEHGAHSREIYLALRIIPRSTPKTMAGVSAERPGQVPWGHFWELMWPRGASPCSVTTAWSHLGPSLSIYAPWDQEINSPVLVLTSCKSCQGAEQGKEILIY